MDIQEVLTEIRLSGKVIPITEMLNQNYRIEEQQKSYLKSTYESPNAFEAEVDGLKELAPCTST